MFVTPSGVDFPTDTIALQFGPTFSPTFGMGAVTFDDLDLAIDTTGSVSDCVGPFTDKTVAAASGVNIWGASVSGQVLTITAPTNAPVDGIAPNTCVQILIGDNAAGGPANDQITNPSSPFNYPLGLAGTFGDTGTGFIFIIDDDQVTVTATVVAPPGGGGGGGGGPPAAPVIFNVHTQNITETSADVLWNTDVSSSSFVDYGLTNAYGSTTSVAGDTFNHTVPLSGLTPGTLYHYRVRSTGSGTPEAVSGDFTFTTLDTTPPVLSNIRATNVTGTGATIEWDTNEDSDSKVEYGTSVSYGSETTSGTMTNAHAINLAGLTPNTVYHYRVTSKDAANNSSTSVDFTFQTLDTIPPNISNINVVNLTETGARITWTTDELADSRVDYGTTVSYGLSVSEGTLVANHQIDLTGLVPGTLYHFKVFSRDAATNEASSGDLTFTTLSDTTPPSNVTNFQATPGNGQNALSWTNPGAADFAGVRIRRSTAGYPVSPTAGSAVYDGTATTFTDVGLTNGTLYYYSAFAYDSSGNFASGALTTGTPFDSVAPGQVGSFTATAGDTHVLLQWSNPVDPDFEETIIKRSTTGYPATPSSGTTVYVGAGTSHDDTGLTNGVTYYYSAFAKDTSNNYSGPAQASAAPFAPPPPGPSCGNAICDVNEDNLSCPADCPAPPPPGPTCGNNACESGETFNNCPADCTAPPAGAVCGNNSCEVSENNNNCPADCPAVPPAGAICGNNACEGGENHNNCSSDCQAPQPPVPTPTNPPAQQIDRAQIEFFAVNRSMPLRPDRNGYYHVLSEETLTIFIPASAFNRAIKSIVLNFNGASYLFARSADGQSYVVDVTMPKSGTKSRGAAAGINWLIQAAEAAVSTVFPGTIIVTYDDDTNDTVTFNISVDSRGYVYEMVDGQQVPIEGALATLYQHVGGNWEIWNASLFSQANPLSTQPDGSFAWMAAEGEYRIDIFKEGYRQKMTAPFTNSTQVINPEIEILKEPPPLLDVIVPGAPFLENAGNVLRNLGQQTSYITQIFQKDFIEDPRVEEAAGSIAAPAAAVITSVIVITAVQATNIASYLYFIVTQPLLLLGRRKRKEYGTVYNTLSKLPIDLTIVRLFRASGKLVRTIVTDKQGRYAFLVERGEYRIEATKPGHKFPSELTAGRREDGKFLDIYHGEVITVGEDGALLTANIPLDPVDVDEKSNRRILWENFGRKLQHVLALGSVVFTLIVLAIYRQPYLLAMAVAQIILYVIFRRLAVPPKPKNWGIIYDEKTNKPIPYAVARIVESRYNKVLESRVADSKGRYNFLVGNNKYFISVEKPGYETRKSTEIDLSQSEQGGGVVDIDIGLKSKPSVGQGPEAPKPPVSQT